MGCGKLKEHIVGFMISYKCYMVGFVIGKFGIKMP
jgi:hypothetical protein